MKKPRTPCGVWGFVTCIYFAHKRWLHRWDVAPLCSLRFARLKVALSAPPTILPCKNGNLFCGDIIFAVVTATARRRVKTANPPVIGKRKDRPTGRSFLLLVAEVGFEPHGLRVMSPTSYQAALLRDMNGAGERGRTVTEISLHGILSPGCLPIPPLRRTGRGRPASLARLLYHTRAPLSSPFSQKLVDKNRPHCYTLSIE